MNQGPRMIEISKKQRSKITCQCPSQEISNEAKKAPEYDFILTNITTEQMYFDTQPTIFDHNYILASISPAAQSRKTITMKEYILASDEF